MRQYKGSRGDHLLLGVKSKSHHKVSEISQVYMGAIILTILITGIVWRQMACEEVWYCSVLLLICRNAVVDIFIYLQGESKKSGISKSMHIALRAIKIKQIIF